MDFVVLREVFTEFGQKLRGRGAVWIEVLVDDEDAHPLVRNRWSAVLLDEKLAQHEDCA
jgi:hypothetical protein